MEWNVDEDTIKLKALYEFNYTRILEFVFHELKFSPLTMPISVDLVRRSKSIFEEFEFYEFYKGIYD